MCGLSEITNQGWVTAHPEETREILRRYRPRLQALDDLNVIQGTTDRPADVGFLLDWLKTQGRRGCRVVAIDPITCMDGTSSQLWRDHERFIRGARRIFEKYEMSLVLIMHPRDMPAGQRLEPLLRNLPGSRMFERSTETIIWMDYHQPVTKRFRTSLGCCVLECNRTIHLLKARNSGLQGWLVGMDFDGRTLTQREVGRID
jgi:hypothetical protein